MFWPLFALTLAFSPFVALLIPPMFMDLSLDSLWFALTASESSVASLCASGIPCPVPSPTPALGAGTGVGIFRVT